MPALRVEVAPGAWDELARVEREPYVQIQAELERLARSLDPREAPRRPFAVVCAGHVLVLQLHAARWKLQLMLVRPERNRP